MTTADGEVHDMTNATIERIARLMHAAALAWWDTLPGEDDRVRQTWEELSESTLVKLCLDYLNLHGIPAWRQNTGAVALDDGRGHRRFVRFGVEGMSDILGILPPSGRLLAVEAKTLTGRLRPAQAAFLARVTDCGGLAGVVRSLEDLQALLRGR